CLLLYRSSPHSDLPSFPTRRSSDLRSGSLAPAGRPVSYLRPAVIRRMTDLRQTSHVDIPGSDDVGEEVAGGALTVGASDPLHVQDRKSTRLNSSHVKISYAVFCLKK